MGEGPLRCLDCQSKFGPAVFDLRCGVCGTLFRLKNFLLSDKFPVSARYIAEGQLRNFYFHLQDVGEKSIRGDFDTGADLSATAAPKVEESAPCTAPKAKPVAPAPLGETSPEPGASSSARGAHREEEPEEKKVSTKESKSAKRERRREEKREGRKSPSKRKDKRKSRSPERRASPVAEVKEETDPELEREAREEIEIEARRKRRDRSRTPLERRGGGARDGERVSPRRPRSPSGLPPPRSPGHRWRGPIPAARERRRGPVAPEERRPENKGRKKKRQQAIFAEFKAWRQQNRGWRY